MTIYNRTQPNKLYLAKQFRMEYVKLVIHFYSWKNDICTKLNGS